MTQQRAEAERDTWTALFELRKKSHIAAGKSEEEADDVASAEVRRLIREAPTR
jgi:hypothetical protein